MSDSLFGFSSIAAFICTAVLFMMMFFVTYQLHFKRVNLKSNSCISSIVEVWVIFGVFFISTILNVISAFGWCEDDQKQTRIKLLIFPLLVTFSCWIYLLYRFGPKFIRENTNKELPTAYFCRDFINGNMRSFMGMVISASFIFHIQCFV
jgi:hypothetical protein